MGKYSVWISELETDHNLGTKFQFYIWVYKQMTHFKIISTSRYRHSSDLLCLSAPRCYYNPTSSHRELHSQLSPVTLLTTESNRNSHSCVSWQHHRTSCSPIISFEQEFSSTWTPSPAEAVRFSPTPGRWCPNWASPGRQVVSRSLWPAVLRTACIHPRHLRSECTFVVYIFPPLLCLFCHTPGLPRAS